MILIQESYDEVLKNYDASKNTSRNILSKYEKAKIIGLRLEQLARGAVPTAKGRDIREIALAELEQRTLPFLVVRVLPNNIKEYFKIEDMIIT